LGLGFIKSIIATEVWNEELQEEHSAMAFQTPDKTWIGVDLPYKGNTVVVDALPPEQTKLIQSCAVDVLNQ
jgi:hypothetical protein